MSNFAIKPVQILFVERLQTLDSRRLRVAASHDESMRIVTNSMLVVS